MQVYKYDEQTKEYIGTEQALINPLESELQGKTIYLLPANATFEKPNLQDGFASVWNGDEWENIEDNRGKEYWLADDEYGTPAHTMKDLGAFPINAVFTAPKQSLDELKREKINQFKSIRDEEELAPINNFDADEKAIMRMNNAIIILDTTKETIIWTLADNSTVKVSADDLRDVIIHIGARSSELHEKYRILKEKIEKCTTEEELAAVKWEE